jgi:hypothetical protein
MTNRDAAIRRAAFDWLAEQSEVHGDVLPRDVLAAGFSYEGDRVPLLGPQGIADRKFKPPIQTRPRRPYGLMVSRSLSRTALAR